MTAQSAPVLDLGFDPHYAHLLPNLGLQKGPSLATRLIVVATIMATVSCGAFALGKHVLGKPSASAISMSPQKIAEVSAMTVDDKSQLLAEGATAEQKNAAIPFSGLPVEHVRGFRLAADAGAYSAALQCLTQAVYYEAGAEPVQGRRAVAQVVLNRMRHPAFPKSVCGVVYQGSQLRTGCQFSFTCDGALLRPPAAGLWRAAQDVARAALAGYVEPRVGTATHYHADYVLPTWAFSLGKITQLGRHIFYRLPGSWGASLAFTGRWSGMETIPQVDLAALQLRANEAEPASLPTKDLVPGLTVPPLASDRHAADDVGGRLDVTKQWRLNIPDPTSASARYESALKADDTNKLPTKPGSSAVAEASAAPSDAKP